MELNGFVYFTKGKFWVCLNAGGEGPMKQAVYKEEEEGKDLNKVLKD